MMSKQEWDNAAGVAGNARRNLPVLVRSYFEEGRRLMSGRWSSEEFHAFRLQTKRLRYTLELFRPCYGSGLERFLKSLRGLQDYLGEISDCATIRELLPRSRDRGKIEKLLSARSRSAIAGLRNYWREQFDRPGEEQRRVAYLARRTHAPLSPRLTP